MDDSLALPEVGILLRPDEFAHFRRFILSEAGIDMPPTKRALVQSRLAPRLRALNFASFTEYWRLLQQPEATDERVEVVNLLSTNETYFFREPQHFDWLRTRARQLSEERKGAVRVWSAACASGEEAYTIAITLAEALGMHAAWHVVATDINTRVVRQAQRAIYPVERVKKTPPHLWQKYFQHGHEEFEGRIRVKPDIARRVEFGNLNLLQSANSRFRDFDVIFLRNVLIYFNEETKNRVVQQVCTKLNDGGYLLTSHAEIIRNGNLPLVQEVPSRYRHRSEPLTGKAPQ